MSKRPHKSVSQRQLRVGEELRHALASLFERGVLRDPVLAGVSVTVTEVRASPDLRNATVFVIPLGGANSDAVVAALKHAAPFLKREVARLVELKYVPNLSFHADDSFDQADRIDVLLHDPKVARDLEAPEDDVSGDEEDPNG